MKKNNYINKCFGFNFCRRFRVIYNRNIQNGKLSKLSFLVAEKNIGDLSREAKKIVVANVDKILPGQLAPDKVNNSDMI
jgi:hypothetical protein